MTQEYFLRDFYCTCDVQNHENTTLVIVSKAIRRSDQQVMDSVTTDTKISEINHWIQDIQSHNFVTPRKWDNIVDHVKRAHLDYFAQRVPITDYYPLNKEDNPDVSNMYQ